MKKLTQRQLDFLSARAMGFSVKEIANIYDVKQITVQKSFNVSKEKLGADTLSELLVTSSQLGLLPLSDEIDDAVNRFPLAKRKMLNFLLMGISKRLELLQKHIWR